MNAVTALLLAIASSAVLALESSAQAPLVPERITVTSGSKMLRGLIWRPPGRGPFPAILFNHGSYPNDEPMPPDTPEKLGPLFARHGYEFLFFSDRASACPPIGSLPRCRARRTRGTSVRHLLGATAAEGHDLVFAGTSTWEADVFAFRDSHVNVRAASPSPAPTVHRLEATPKTVAYGYYWSQATLFKPGIVIPLKPFFGSMGVAPAPEIGRVSSNPQAGTPAISTTASSSSAARCIFRSSSAARCSRSATAMRRRATVKSIKPRSRHRFAAACS